MVFVQGTIFFQSIEDDIFIVSSLNEFYQTQLLNFNMESIF